MTTMSRFRRALRAFAAAWRGEGFVTRSEVEIIVCDVTERILSKVLADTAPAARRADEPTDDAVTRSTMLTDHGFTINADIADGDVERFARQIEPILFKSLADAATLAASHRRIEIGMR
jgi:hypothetical protein